MIPTYSTPHVEGITSVLATSSSAICTGDHDRRLPRQRQPSSRFAGFANDPNNRTDSHTRVSSASTPTQASPYVAWATSILELVAPKPVSLEVVCDDLKEMREQALRH